MARSARGEVLDPREVSVFHCIHRGVRGCNFATVPTRGSQKLAVPTRG